MPLMQLVQPDEVTVAAGTDIQVGKIKSDTPDVVKTAATQPAATADFLAAVIGYLLIAAGAAVGVILWNVHDPAAFTPGEGISVFAPLYILAQAIERFIEPFSSYLGKAAPGDAPADKKSKAEAQMELGVAIAKGQASAAAKWQKVVDQIRRNTAVIAWGLASFLAMTLCGLFGIFLLRLVGLSGVPEEFDIIISGLAVGSGTKPLHDLISNVQKAKEQKEDPPEKKAA
jgi:hypothetical protein